MLMRHNDLLLRVKGGQAKVLGKNGLRKTFFIYAYIKDKISKNQQ